METLQKSFGKSSMNKQAIYKWYKRFEDGRESVKDDDRTGRHRTSITGKQVEKVKEEEVGISYGSCEEMFTNILGMKRMAAEFVPKLLIFEQKMRHKTKSCQWKLPNKPRAKKAYLVLLNVKVLIAHHEFLTQGATVNEEYYLSS